VHLADKFSTGGLKYMVKMSFSSIFSLYRSIFPSPIKREAFKIRKWNAIISKIEENKCFVKNG